MGLFIAVGLLVMLVAVLIGQPDLVSTLFFPTAMLLGAMFFTSIYFTFRDSFVAEEADTTAPS